MFEAYRHAAGMESSAHVTDRLWGWILAPDNEVEAIVAVMNEKLLGFAHYRRFARPIMADEGLFLDDLFTSPEARGRGVARALMDHLMAETGFGPFRGASVDHETRQCGGPALVRRLRGDRGHRHLQRKRSGLATIMGRSGARDRHDPYESAPPLRHEAAAARARSS